jgi:GNAT superfamily N-acetyltransferase
MPPAGPIRPALDHELALLADSYRRASFNPQLAEVDRFARDTLGGEVFVAEQDGDLVGASACASFGQTGWVGAVAVVPERRRGGLGRALTQAAIERLFQLGARTVMLYATEMGRPLYERLGFVAEGECVTVGGERPARRGPLRRGASRGGSMPDGVRPARAGDLEVALDIDRDATGENRAGLLTAFWPRGALVAESGGRLRGYFLSSPWRPGGGIVAEDPDSGLALIAAARQHTGGELYLSIPSGNVPALRALAVRGVPEHSRTTRMRLGPPLEWQPLALFSTFNLFWG